MHRALAQWYDRITVDSTVVAKPSLSTIRSSYVSQVDDLVGLGYSMRAAGSSAEDVVRTIGPLRNQLKLGLRSQGSWPAARAADARNFIKYGNRAGPKADYLYKKYHSWEKVFDAISRTNPTVNRILGQ